MAQACRLSVLTAALLLLSGCANESPRLNAPPHGESSEASNLQGTFIYMTDNALLADMTISDVHFLPHRPLLTDAGERRLSRLASLIDAYGGTIRLNTDEPNEQLVKGRTETVVNFLREAGLVASAQTVTRDIPGGAGMDATQAILIKANEGSYTPRRSGGGNAGSGNASYGAGASGGSSR